MGQIAEDLFLLLLDNASARPALDRPRRERVLSAAVLLDLAYECRIRPALADEPIDTGALLVLAAPGIPDPVARPALELLARKPLRPDLALTKLGRHVERQLAEHLERIGEIRRMTLPTKGFRHEYAWPLQSRDRVGRARADVLTALFDGRAPAPPTATIIALLHAVDGLGALLSLNDRGWRFVHARATEISTGTWVDDTGAALAEMNLALTTSALRPALM
jgi:hypothetical protein